MIASRPCSPSHRRRLLEQTRDAAPPGPTGRLLWDAVLDDLDELHARRETAEWVRGALRRLKCLVEDETLWRALEQLWHALGGDTPGVEGVRRRAGWKAMDGQVRVSAKVKSRSKSNQRLRSKSNRRKNS